MIILGKVKEVTSEFIKTHIFGNSDVRTAPQVLPFGIDSKPIKESMALYAETDNKSKAVTLGVITKSDKTNPGELRLSATDENGVEKTYVFLTNDGDIEVGGNDDNLVRYSVLKQEFDKFKSDFNLFVTTKYNLHVHPVPGITSGPSATTSSVTTTVGSSSNADISDSKIQKVKTYKTESEPLI